MPEKSILIPFGMPAEDVRDHYDDCIKEVVDCVVEAGGRSIRLRTDFAIKAADEYLFPDLDHQSKTAIG